MQDVACFTIRGIFFLAQRSMLCELLACQAMLIRTCRQGSYSGEGYDSCRRWYICTMDLRCDELMMMKCRGTSAAHQLIFNQVKIVNNDGHYMTNLSDSAMLYKMMYLAVTC